MAEGDSIQVLLSKGPFNTRAALEATAAICAALEAHTPVQGGRSLTAASVLLFTDGNIQLQNVDQADAFAVGTLLAQMLLGALPTDSEDSSEELLVLLNANLQTPDVDNAWRRKLVNLVRACRSLDTSSRPPLHRVQRRCQDLTSDASGLVLRKLIKKRTEETGSWMDLPAVNESNAAISKMIIQPPNPREPQPAEPPPRTSTNIHLKTSGGTPSPPPESPTLWRNLTIAMAAAALLVGGIAVYQLTDNGSAPLVAQPSSLVETSQTIDWEIEKGHRLELISSPEGAIVMIDGSLIGQTPTETRGLESGVYQLTLTLGDAFFQQALMIDQDAECAWSPEAEARTDAWVCGKLRSDP